MTDYVTPIRPGASGPSEHDMDSRWHSLSPEMRQYLMDRLDNKPEAVAPRAMTRFAPRTSALLAIGHARAIADTIYNGTSEVDGSFLEELGASSVNALMNVLIEKLDFAIEHIERPDNE